MPVAWQARRARMARFDSAEGRAKAAAARTPAPRLALAGMRRTGFRAHAKTVGRIMHMLASKKHKILVVARKFRRTGMAPAHTMVFLPQKPGTQWDNFAAYNFIFLAWKDREARRPTSLKPGHK